MALQVVQVDSLSNGTSSSSGGLSNGSSLQVVQVDSLSNGTSSSSGGLP